MGNMKYLLYSIPVIFSFIIFYLIAYIILSPVIGISPQTIQVNTEIKKNEDISLPEDFENKILNHIGKFKIKDKKHKKIAVKLRKDDTEGKLSEREAEEFVNLIIKEAVEEFHNKDKKEEKPLLERIKELF
ncbi:hypothetical protein [Persephonella sp.]